MTHDRLRGNGKKKSLNNPLTIGKEVERKINNFSRNTYFLI